VLVGGLVLAQQQCIAVEQWKRHKSPADCELIMTMTTMGEQADPRLQKVIKSKAKIKLFFQS
jgi:hypothetical protein